MNNDYLYEHFFFDGKYKGIDGHSFILNNTEIIQFGEEKLNASIEVLTFKEFALIYSLFNKHLEFNSYTHKQWSIVFSLKEAQVLSLNCENLQKNDIVIVPPYTHISSVFLGNISQPCRIAINDNFIKELAKKQFDNTFDFNNKEIKIIHIDDIDQFRNSMTSVFKKANKMKDLNFPSEIKKLINNEAQQIVKNAVKVLLESQNHEPKQNNKTLFYASNYMRYLKDEEFNIKKITDHVGFKDRTLRHKFLKSFNVSPKRFHTSLRLHEVMKALLDGDNKTIISDIANVWGFWHMGQFAKSYRKSYGELPSETLKKSNTSYSKYIQI